MPLSTAVYIHYWYLDGPIMSGAMVRCFEGICILVVQCFLSSQGLWQHATGNFWDFFRVLHLLWCLVPIYVDERAMVYNDVVSLPLDNVYRGHIILATDLLGQNRETITFVQKSREDWYGFSSCMFGLLLRAWCGLFFVVGTRWITYVRSR